MQPTIEMKRKLLILFTVILAISFICYKGYNWGSENGIINANKLIVKVSKPLQKSKLTIINEFTSMNRPNDKTMLNSYDIQNAIYLEGSYKKRPYSDDENDFLFIYDNKYYCYFRYLKYNVIMDDQHYFAVFKNNNDIFVHVIIKPEKIDFYIKMSPIANAQFLNFDVTKGGDR